MFVFLFVQVTYLWVIFESLIWWKYVSPLRQKVVFCFLFFLRKWYDDYNAESLRGKKASRTHNYPVNINPETFQVARGKLQETYKILIKDKFGKALGNLQDCDGDKFQLFRCSTVLGGKLSYDEVF